MNTEIRVGRNESLETAISRFKQACRRAGLYEELERRRYYEKPSVKRKNKARRAEQRKIQEERLAALRQRQYESRRGNRYG
jgi:small subunit ribosomal protein S21